MKKVLLLIVALIASGCWSGALGVEEGLTRVVLEAEEIAYTPTANGVYEVYLFPETEDADAEVEIWSGEELIASGSGRLGVLSARLTAGTTYAIRMKGKGSALLEIARETLSRCYDMPLELGDGEGYSKLVAREGDVHWYAVDATRTGAALITARPEDGSMKMGIRLFDENGGMLAESTPLNDGGCAASYPFEAGRRYYVRVVSEGKGKYVLSSLRSAVAGVPEKVTLSRSEMTLTGRTKGLLLAETSPAGVCPLVFYESSNPDVAIAHPDGTVETRNAGTAVITAHAYGGASASCEITVERVAVSGVRIDEEEIHLRVGDEYGLRAVIEPAHATERGVTFESADESVVRVDAKGELSAVGTGGAHVRVRTADGGLTDEVYVIVAPAPKKYRALLIGEQNYASTVESVRPGSMNSVLSIEKLLNTAELGESRYEVRTLMDAPRDSVIAAIRETFAEAGEGDLSVIYITCHGFYKGGMSFFLMADGSVLSAVDLERELRGISGEVVLMADCCGSGGLLGEAGGTDDFLNGVMSVFQGMQGSATMHGSKIKVLASALLDQDSYRISFSDDSEKGMATVFARALCDGMGWSIDRDAKGSMNADANYDGEITLNELAEYMSRRVMWYLQLAGAYVQTVNVYPEGSGAILFAR